MRFCGVRVQNQDGPEAAFRLIELAQLPGDGTRKLPKLCIVGFRLQCRLDTIAGGFETSLPEVFQHSCKRRYIRRRRRGRCRERCFFLCHRPQTSGLMSPGLELSNACALGLRHPCTGKPAFNMPLQESNLLSCFGHGGFPVSDSVVGAGRIQTAPAVARLLRPSHRHPSGLHPMSRSRMFQ